MKEKIRHYIEENWPFFVVVALMAVMLLCGSCKGTERIVVAHDTIYKTNTEYRERTVHDSTYLRDTMWIRGDTIWRDRYKYVLRERVDTLAVHDTSYVQVDIPYEVVKVKTKVPWWAWVSTGISIILIASIICIATSPDDINRQ